MTVANVKKQHLLQVLKLIVYQITLQRTKLFNISLMQEKHQILQSAQRLQKEKQKLKAIFSKNLAKRL